MSFTTLPNGQTLKQYKVRDEGFFRYSAQIVQTGEHLVCEALPDTYDEELGTELAKRGLST